MQGPDIYDSNEMGLVPRMIETVFEGIDRADENIEFTLQVSFMEIYMERIRDLLDPSKDDLRIREDSIKGVYVENLTAKYVTDDVQIFEALECGFANRSTGETNMNQRSSRSHSIFVLTMEQRNIKTLSAKTGRLYMVDLAGSEKVRKTGAEGARFDEAKKINLSLLVLGRVINSLTDGTSTSIPYRESKLTRVLQESLGGNSRTTLVINCSPSVYNADETISTLRFGKRAKTIQNKAHVNAELSLAELKLLLTKAQHEIVILKKQLVAEGKYQPEVGEREGDATSALDPTAVGELNMRLSETEQEKSILEETVSDLNSQVKALKNQIAAMETEHDQAHRTYELQLERVVQDRDGALALVQSHETSILSMQHEMKILQAALVEEREHRGASEAKLVRTQAEAEVLNKLVSDLELTVNRSQSSPRNSSSLNSTSSGPDSSHTGGSRGDAGSSTNAVNPLISQISSLKLERNVSVKELASVKSQMESMQAMFESQRAEMEVRIADLQAETASLGTKLSKAVNSNMDMKEEVERYSHKVANLTDLVEFTESESKTAAAELHAAQENSKRAAAEFASQVRNLEGDRADLSSKAQELQREIVATRESHQRVSDDFHERLKKSNADKAAIEIEYARKVEELTDLGGKLSQFDVEKKDLNEQISNLHTLLLSSTTEIELARQSLSLEESKRVALQESLKSSISDSDAKALIAAENSFQVQRNEELSKRVSDLEASLMGSTLALKAAEVRLQSREAALDVEAQGKITLLAEVKELKEDALNNSRLLEQLNEELSSRNDLLMSGDSKLLEKALEIHVLKTQLSEQEKKIVSLTTEFDDKYEALHKSLDANKSLSMKIQSLQRSEQSYMEEVKRLREEGRKERGLLLAQNESNINVAVAEAVAQSQQANKRTSLEQIVTWQTRLKSSSQRIEDLEKEVTLKENEISVLQGIVNVQESKQRALEERIASAERMGKKSETALQTALLEAKLTSKGDGSHERKSMEFSALWDAHLSLISQMESQAHKLVDAEESLRNRCDRVAKLEMQLDEEKDKVLTLKKIIEKGPQKVLEKRVNQLTELCHAREQTNSGLEIQIKILEKKLKRAVEALDSERVLRESTQAELHTFDRDRDREHRVGSNVELSTSIRGGGGRVRRGNKESKSPRSGAAPPAALLSPTGYSGSVFSSIFGVRSPDPSVSMPSSATSSAAPSVPSSAAPSAPPSLPPSAVKDKKLSPTKKSEKEHSPPYSPLLVSQPKFDEAVERLESL